MDDLRFDGRTAIVTGSGRGLGREHALELARRGARVLVNDIGGGTDGSGSSEGPAAQVVREIEELGGAAASNTDNVASATGAQAMVDAAIEAFGRLDIVINNAGINLSGGFADMPPEDFRRVVEVQFDGTVQVLRAAWPHLVRSGAARVVNTTSAAFQGWRLLSAYSAGKAAVFGLTRTLAREGQAVGIKVNALAPVGLTRMTASTGLTPDAIEALGRIIRPHYPSAVAAYLAHESCAVNGEVLSCCGPRVARLFVAETRGILEPQLTAELVADRIDNILDEAGYATFPDGEASLAAAVRAAAGVQSS